MQKYFIIRNNFLYQIRIETQPSVITPTTAQTSAYLSSSSGNLSNTLYTTGTEAEIKLKEINNKMKEFHNQYGTLLHNR